MFVGASSTAIYLASLTEEFGSEIDERDDVSREPNGREGVHNHRHRAEAMVKAAGDGGEGRNERVLSLNGTDDSIDVGSASFAKKMAVPVCLARAAGR